MPEHPTDAHFSFSFVFKQALRVLWSIFILNQIKHYTKLSSKEIADEIDAMSKKENDMW